MEKISHKSVPVNGINMHIAEIGSGPRTVLLLHGYPELWYTWRHQLLYLSSHNYRAIAPDLRGYGDTDAPPYPTSYTSFHVVGDLVALLDYLEIDQVFLVGHDWGAIIAWHFCLFRPDRIKALVNLSVPFFPRNPKSKPVQGMRMAFGDNFYICRFQEPGVEEEFAALDTAMLLKRILTSRDPRPPIIPPGGWGGPPGVDITLPPWLSEEDVNYYAEKFKQKGFTGALNYYRAMDITWELTAPWTGVQIKVPVKFMIGELDLTMSFPGTKDYIEKGGFKNNVPLLQEVVIMEGAAHFINQEKAEEVSKHILDFIQIF
ncbi:hypothetical protein Ancab_021854 [Ancistrocladus abbreviatus]